MTAEDKKTVNVIRASWPTIQGLDRETFTEEACDIHDLLSVIDSQEKRIEFLTVCLEKIRQHGNMTVEDAVWMQQTAAHGIKPERWPMPGEKPLTSSRQEKKRVIDVGEEFKENACFDVPTSDGRMDRVVCVRSNTPDKFWNWYDQSSQYLYCIDLTGPSTAKNVREAMDHQHATFVSDVVLKVIGDLYVVVKNGRGHLEDNCSNSVLATLVSGKVA
jgi:hypothetical protein